MYLVYGKAAKYLWVLHKMERVFSSEVEGLVWIRLSSLLLCEPEPWHVQLHKASKLLEDGTLVWCADNKKDLLRLTHSLLPPHLELDFHISNSAYVTM